MYINPYEGLNENSNCQRSNFHTHIGTGADTCGSLEIDDVLSEYSRLNYSAVSITNHNVYTDPSDYKNHGLCLVKGYEYTKDIHMVCLGTDKLCLGSYQEAIDSAVSDGGIAILCHPNWQREWQIPKDTIDSLHRFAGIEIYNGSIDCGPIREKNNSNGRCNASNVFDYILSNGRLVWCFGNDDLHRWWYLAIAWNMIYSEKSESDIINAVKEGKFYVSTGLLLEELSLKESRINVNVRNNEGFKDIYRYRFIGKNGKILKEVYEENASYDLCGDEMYVRIEVTGSSGKMLYTQPIYDKNKFTREII